MRQDWRQHGKPPGKSLQGPEGRAPAGSGGRHVGTTSSRLQPSGGRSRGLVSAHLQVSQPLLQGAIKSPKPCSPMSRFKCEKRDDPKWGCTHWRSPDCSRTRKETNAKAQLQVAFSGITGFLRNISRKQVSILISVHFTSLTATVILCLPWNGKTRIWDGGCHWKLGKVSALSLTRLLWGRRKAEKLREESSTGFSLCKEGLELPLPQKRTSVPAPLNLPYENPWCLLRS